MKEEFKVIRRTNLVIAAGTASAYLLLFQLNDYLFSSFAFSKGVDWIFLPSGLRLVFILIFVAWGAFGIVLASFAIGLGVYFNGDVVTALGAGIISGMSPLLARLVCINSLKLDVNLERLTPSTLLKVAAVFAVISPVMHQLWFVARGYTENFLSSTTVMALGDFTGTITVLYGSKVVINALHRRAKI